MEIYRQYAEHYRKIVTDINERRQSRMDNNQNRNNEQENSLSENNSSDEVAQPEKNEVVEVSDNGYVETLPATDIQHKTFEVVEIKEDTDSAATKETVKPKRICRRKTSVKKADKEA
jgi:hypothetical protein